LLNRSALKITPSKAEKIPDFSISLFLTLSQQTYSGEI